MVAGKRGAPQSPPALHHDAVRVRSSKAREPHNRDPDRGGDPVHGVPNTSGSHPHLLVFLRKGEQDPAYSGEHLQLPRCSQLGNKLPVILRPLGQVSSDFCPHIFPKV